MIDVLKDIEKARDNELWALLGTLSVTLKNEMDANKGDMTRNNKVWFWYDLYKAIESEIDKRMKAEG